MLYDLCLCLVNTLPFFKNNDCLLEPCFKSWMATHVSSLSWHIQYLYFFNFDIEYLFNLILNFRFVRAFEHLEHILIHAIQKRSFLAYIKSPQDLITSG